MEVGNHQPERPLEYNFEYYTDLLMENNNSIFDNPFVQHLFFDHYIKEGDGNSSIEVLKVFLYLLSTFTINEEFKQKIINLLVTSIEMSSKLVKDDFDIFIQNVNDILNEKNELLLMGGFNTFRGESGHAISIYIKKKSEDNYELYIINSGSGVENHSHLLNKELVLNDELIQDGDIIIKIDNLNFSDITNFIQMQKKLINESFQLGTYISSLIPVSDSLMIESNILEDNNRLVQEKINELMNDKKIFDKISVFPVKTIGGQRFAPTRENIMSEDNLPYRRLYLSESTDYKPYFDFLVNNFRNKKIKSDFIELLEKDIQFVNIFYQYFLENFFQQKPIQSILIDRKQISGSCSFYSIYYFLKFFFIENLPTDGLSIFNQFDTNIRIKTLNSILSDYYYSKYFLKMNQDNVLVFKSSLQILNKDYNTLLGGNEIFINYFKKILNNEDLIRHMNENILRFEKLEYDSNVVNFDNLNNAYEELLKKINTPEPIFDLELYNIFKNEYLKLIDIPPSEHSEKHKLNYFYYFYFLILNIFTTLFDYEKNNINYNVKNGEKNIILGKSFFIKENLILKKKGTYTEEKYEEKYETINFLLIFIILNCKKLTKNISYVESLKNIGEQHKINLIVEYFVCCNQKISNTLFLLTNISNKTIPDIVNTFINHHQLLVFYVTYDSSEEQQFIYKSRLEKTKYLFDYLSFSLTEKENEIKLKIWEKLLFKREEYPRQQPPFMSKYYDSIKYNSLVEYLNQENIDEFTKYIGYINLCFFQEIDTSEINSIFNQLYLTYYLNITKCNSSIIKDFQNKDEALCETTKRIIVPGSYGQGNRTETIRFNLKSNYGTLNNILTMRENQNLLEEIINVFEIIDMNKFMKNIFNIMTKCMEYYGSNQNFYKTYSKFYTLLLKYHEELISEEFIEINKQVLKDPLFGNSFYMSFIENNLYETFKTNMDSDIIFLKIYFEACQKYKTIEESEEDNKFKYIFNIIQKYSFQIINEEIHFKNDNDRVKVHSKYEDIFSVMTETIFVYMEDLKNTVKFNIQNKKKEKLYFQFVDVNTYKLFETPYKLLNIEDLKIYHFINEIEEYPRLNNPLLLRFENINEKYLLFINLENENQFLIKLIEHLDYNFYYERDGSNEIYKVEDIKNNKIYRLVIDLIQENENYLIKNWMFGLNNGFLLKSMNQLNNEYKILYIINDNFIKTKLSITKNNKLKLSENLPKEYDKEFFENNGNMPLLEYHSELCIISLHPSLLFSTSQNFRELFIEFLSLVFSHNEMYLIILINKLINTFMNEKMKNKEELRNNIYYCNFINYIKDSSLMLFIWPFFEKIKYSKYHKRIDLFFTKTNIINEEEFEIKIPVNQEKIIHNIQIIKRYIDTFFRRIEEIENNKPRLTLLKENEDLIDFLNLIFFYSSKEHIHINEDTLLPLLTLNKNINNPILQSIQSIYQQYQEYSDSIINQYFESNVKRSYNLNNNGTIFNFNNLLLNNTGYLYSFIYIINFLNIYDEIINILKLDATKTNKFESLKNSLLLGEIYKSIDDKVILSESLVYRMKGEKIKEIYEILFEIENLFYIRRQQKSFIDEINNNIIEERYELAYQLLMGRGKTAVITPLLIMKEYFEKNQHSFIIILPEQLVLTSYTIMNRFIKYFDNTFIIKNISGKKMENLNEDNRIFITSDVLLKTYIVQKIKEKRIENKIDYHQLLSSETFYIIDEIDSIIDPLKSNLNLVSDEPTHIEDYNRLCEIFLQLIFKNIDNIKEKNIDNLNHFVDELITDNEELNLLLKKSIQFIIKKDFNGQGGYGFGAYNYDNYEFIYKTNYFTCIPYTFVDDPMNGSKFSDLEITLITTIYGYYLYWSRYGIRIYDLFFILREIIELDNKLKIENIELANLIYPVFYHVFGEDIKKMKELYELNIHDQKFYIPYLIKNQENLNEHLIPLLIEYLKNIIFKYFMKVNLELYNISFIDILGMLDKKIMFTGTPDFLIPIEEIKEMIQVPDGRNMNNYLKNPPNLNERRRSTKLLVSGYSKKICNEIIPDRYSEGAIKSSILGILSESTNIPELIYYESQANNLRKFQKLSITERNFMNFIFKSNILLKYQSIIDVAGYILETNVYQFVEMLSRYFSSKNIFKKILFVNDLGERFIYEPIIKEGLNNISRRETEYKNFVKILKYQEEVFLTDELFIYYDNKHTVGIDFKQPLIMHGLVLISEDNTLTEVAQGIFRLRKMNVTHTVDFYVEKSTFDKILLNNGNSKYTGKQEILSKLFKFLKNNGEKYKNSTQYFMKLQCLKYLVRRITGNGMYYKENIIPSISLILKKNISFESIDIIYKKIFKELTNIDVEFEENKSDENMDYQHELEEEDEEEVERKREKKLEKKIERKKDKELDSSQYFKEHITYQLNTNITFINYLSGSISDVIRTDFLNSITLFEKRITLKSKYFFNRHELIIQRDLNTHYPIECQNFYLLKYDVNQFFIVDYLEYYNFKLRFNLFKWLTTQTEEFKTKYNSLRINGFVPTSDKHYLIIKNTLGNKTIETLSQDFSKFIFYDASMNLVLDGSRLNSTFSPLKNIKKINKNLPNRQNDYYFYQLIYLLFFQLPMDMKDIYQIFKYFSNQDINTQMNISYMFYFVEFLKGQTNSEFILQKSGSPINFNQIDTIPNIFDYLSNDENIIKFFNISVTSENPIYHILLRYIKEPSFTKENLLQECMPLFSESFTS